MKGNGGYIRRIILFLNQGQHIEIGCLSKSSCIYEIACILMSVSKFVPAIGLFRTILQMDDELAVAKRIYENKREKLYCLHNFSVQCVKFYARTITIFSYSFQKMWGNCLGTKYKPENRRKLPIQSSQVIFNYLQENIHFQ